MQSVLRAAVLPSLSLSLGSCFVWEVERMSYRGVRKFYHDGNRLLLFNTLKIHTKRLFSFPTPPENTMLYQNLCRFLL